MDRRTAYVHSVTQKLRILFRVIQAHSKQIEKECGLSGAKLWMLYEIYLSPGCKVSELAGALTIHPSTCSNMLDKLEQEHLIYRDRSKKDQRAVHLYLTSAGEELLAKAPQPAQGKLSRALERMDEEDLANLEKGLDGLACFLRDEGSTDLLPPIPGD